MSSVYVEQVHSFELLNRILFYDIFVLCVCLSWDIGCFQKNAFKIAIVEGRVIQCLRICILCKHIVRNSHAQCSHALSETCLNSAI